ncbi:MAG: hypothetical protein AMXMBFR47_05830 [Planctomycetota bacterium]
MPNYRRWFEPGGTYYFTVVTENRAPILCGRLARKLLRGAVERTRDRWPFQIFAWVLLPDHMHTIWTMPPDDCNYPRRWAFLKKEFTSDWLDAGGAEQVRSASRRRNRRRGVWQRTYWENLVKDDRDLFGLADYIHHNPIKHGYVECAHAWQYSTFHRFVRDGWYPADWCCACNGNKSKMHIPKQDIIDMAGE